jgi:hypothetical protein
MAAWAESAPVKDEIWTEELAARVSSLLRREPVPPAALLEHCCAVLDEALRLQRPGSTGIEAPPTRFARLDDRLLANEEQEAEDEPEPHFGNSLPLRSLQPGYPKYDARSRVFVDRYQAGAGTSPTAMPVDVRQAKIERFVAALEGAEPPPHARRAGTQIGGGYSRTKPLHQARYKRITIRPTDVAAWGMLRSLIPELGTATELTISNFPAPGGQPKDAVDAGRGPDADLTNTAQRTLKAQPEAVSQFTEPRKIELTFLKAPTPTQPAAQPFYRKLTLQPDVLNLLKDMDGELFYDWHTDSFSRTANGVYGGENGDQSVSVIERRLEQQRAERAQRVKGALQGWRV